MKDRNRDVGLFRYSLVREPGDPALSKAERGALVRALAGMEHATPDGRYLRVGRSTLDGRVDPSLEGRRLRSAGAQAKAYPAAHRP